MIYTTRSIHSQENEQVVNHAIKWFREKNENNRPFRVCPPTLPVLSTDLKDEAGSKKQLTSTQSLKHNFLNMRQNEQMNGCFIAVLVREVIAFDLLLMFGFYELGNLAIFIGLCHSLNFFVEELKLMSKAELDWNKSLVYFSKR